MGHFLQAKGRLDPGPGRQQRGATTTLKWSALRAGGYMRSARISGKASCARIPRHQSTAASQLTEGKAAAGSGQAPAPGWHPRAGWTRDYSPSKLVRASAPLCSSEHRQSVLLYAWGRRPYSRPGCLLGMPVTPVSWEAPPFASTKTEQLCQACHVHPKAEQSMSGLSSGVGLSSPLGSKRMKRDFYNWYLNASLDGADVRAFIAATVQMPSYRREGKYMVWKAFQNQMLWDGGLGEGGWSGGEGWSRGQSPGLSQSSGSSAANPSPRFHQSRSLAVARLGEAARKLSLFEHSLVQLGQENVQTLQLFKKGWKIQKRKGEKVS